LAGIYFGVFFGVVVSRDFAVICSNFWGFFWLTGLPIILVTSWWEAWPITLAVTLLAFQPGCQ
jgi:hypothetical protein